MARRKQPGVYKITNARNGKCYIGSTTINLQQRWNDHKSQLRTGKHPNIHLQRSWVKNAGFSFVFEILEECENVLEREQFYIGLFQPEYNINPIARNSAGVKRRKETCDKISLLKMGNKNKLGLEVTKGTRAEISKTLIAKYASGEIIHPMLDKSHTKESRALMSSSKGGNSIRKDNPTYRGFIQLDSTTLAEIARFDTARQSADAVGRVDKPASSKVIRACRTGNVAYGYRWGFENVQVKSGELLEA